MRKIICCALALLLMMGAAVVPAAAETKTGFYDFQAVDDVTVTAEDATGPVENGSDRLKVVYSKATTGCNYFIALVPGTSVTINKDDINTKGGYVSQKNKATSSSITFDVLPKLPTSDMDMTLFITSDDGNPAVSVSMKYAAGGSAFMIGDADNNSKVNMKDKLLLDRYIAKWPDADKDIVNMDAMDIDRSGGLPNMKDKLILDRYIAKWGGKWAEYFK